MAMSAAFFLPADRAAILQNFSFRKQSFRLAAAHAHSVKALRSQGFPPVVLLLLFFPALRLLPGHTPAHELNFFSLSNALISLPVSASMVAALVC